MNVIVVADEQAEFSPLISALESHGASVHQRLLEEIRGVLPDELDKTNDDLSVEDQKLRDAYWSRQSLAAVTLVHLGIKEDYQELEGYRLPNESEWDLACRAGATGTYPFGEPIALLSQYAWYVRNSEGRTHSVGALKPNDFGLFDTLGNVWECVLDSPGGLSPVSDKNRRIWCGAQFGDMIGGSAARFGDVPTNSFSFLGFRLVRSIPSQP